MGFCPPFYLPEKEGTLDPTTTSIWELAEPVAADSGLEVLEVELGGNPSQWVVRVYLDKPVAGRGVTLADCEAMSRRLGDAIEAHEAVRGRYRLEVSSPGVNRPLMKPEHFRRVVGERVKVIMVEETHGRRSFSGRLDRADQLAVTVTDDAGLSTRLPLDGIERANYEFPFDDRKRKRQDCR